jgi:hypothetical protein
MRTTTLLIGGFLERYLGQDIQGSIISGLILKMSLMPKPNKQPARFETWLKMLYKERKSKASNLFQTDKDKIKLANGIVDAVIEDYWRDRNLQDDDDLIQAWHAFCWRWKMAIGTTWHPSVEPIHLGLRGGFSPFQKCLLHDGQIFFLCGSH